MKKWLLLLAFPIQLDAQTLLKPGLYRDLKPDKPIVLDTGSYTFIGLEMKNLGKGVWLDACKARSLRLIGCRFEGNHTGIMVLVGDKTEISHCQFLEGEVSVKVGQNKEETQNSQSEISVRNCHFWGNSKAIHFASGSISATVKCNYFFPGKLKTATGIFLDSLASILYSTLNEADGIGFQAGGNVWPKKRNVNESPEGWTSFWNENKKERIVYTSYIQEFVGKTHPTSGPGMWFIRADHLAPTPYYIRNFCFKMFPDDQNKFYSCTRDPNRYANLPFDVYPDFCYAYDDPTEIDFDSNLLNEPLMGDPIPNPSKETATIELIWIQDIGKLVVFDLASGKEVLSRMLGPGRQKIEIDVSKLASGVYGYRLEGECPCPEPKRLIVIH